MAHPPVEPGDQTDLDGIDQPSAVAEVGVDQGPGDTGGPGQIFEGDQQRVALGEQALCGVQDETAPDLRVQAMGPAPARRCRCSADAGPDADRHHGLARVERKMAGDVLPRGHFGHLGYLVGAALFCPRAAGAEAAARRW